MNNFLCPIADKHSNKSWNWFVKSSIPGALLPVPENFRRRFSWLNWPTLGLRGCFYQRNNNNNLKLPSNIFLIVNAGLFVNFSNVAVVHKGFHNKERQPEQQNNSSCQCNRRRLIPTKMFVWVAERTFKTSLEGSQLFVTCSQYNFENQKTVFQDTHTQKKASGASQNY